MSADFYYVTPDTSIREVAASMDEYGLSCLPVVSSGRLAGIVTTRDLALRAHAAGGDHESPVSLVMTPSVVYCHRNDDVQSLCGIMIAHGVRRMPVLDERERPVGFVSLCDLIPALSRTALSDLVHALWGSARYMATGSSDAGSGTWQEVASPHEMVRASSAC